MNVNAELKAAIVNYAKTRPVFEGYKAARYSKKYLAEHEADIATYRAAGATKMCNCDHICPACRLAESQNAR